MPNCVDFSHSTGFGQSYPSHIINNGDGAAGRSSTDILNLTETTTINYRLNINGDHDFNFMWA